jgi:hypothetical protein
MSEYYIESSILGHTMFMFSISFPIFLILFIIIFWYFLKIEAFLVGIFSFIISSIITIFYYICQKKRKCKIREIGKKRIA